VNFSNTNVVQFGEISIRRQPTSEWKLAKQAIELLYAAISGIGDTHGCMASKIGVFFVNCSTKISCTNGCPYCHTA